MKTIVEQAVGGDGAKAGLYVEGDQLTIKVGYPIAKLVSPITDVIDAAIDKIEALVPGDWDKALLEPIRAEAKAALVKVLAE